MITPTFNRSHLLPRCVDSVLAQTFSSYELIVVDDGSTDGTESLVGEYGRCDSRVQLLKQTNQGANSARNFGSRVAKGQYLVFLDSDDAAKPQWLAKLNELALIAQDPAVACCGIDFFGSDGRHLASKQPIEELCGSNTGGNFNSGTFAVRRDVFSELGGFAESLPAHQHSEFRLRLFDLCGNTGYRIVSIPDRLINAYTHNGPKIRGNAQAKLDATKYILAHHSDKFQRQQSVAAWQASAGGCAAELRRYREARKYFASAIHTCPRAWKNYLRLGICCTPGLRGLFWRDTSQAKW